MKTWVRRPALTLIAAAAIALALASWSGSQEAHTARLKSLAAVFGAVASAPAAAPRAPASKPGALIDCAACLVEADEALFAVEPVSAGEPWSPIVVGYLAGAPVDLYDRPNGISFASLDPSATASPAPELSTAAMVALGVVLLTVRRAGRNRWASWKAPWKVSTVPASG